MYILLFGFLIFFGLHVFSSLRSRADDGDLRARLGYIPYMAGYSVISLIGLGLIIYGYGESRGGPLLYTPPTFLQHLNSVFMLPALILLAASEMPAGRIKRAAKHPMLLSVKLWATGHLLANGELNSVLLFGSFLAYAVFARIMAKKRGDNGVGDDVVLSKTADIGAILVGTGLFVILAVWLHPLLFGVQAIPVS